MAYRNFEELKKDLGYDPSLQGVVTAPEMLAYVDGYILALRDIIGDIDQWYMNEDQHSQWYEALDAVRFSISESLSSAELTLERLK